MDEWTVYLVEGRKVNNRYANYKSWWYDMVRILPEVNAKSWVSRRSSSYPYVVAILADTTNGKPKYVKSFMNVNV